MWEVISNSSNNDCVHKFHKAFIIEWLMKSDTCPVCRCGYLKNSTNKAKKAEVIILEGEDRVTGEEFKENPNTTRRSYEAIESVEYNESTNSHSDEIIEETKENDIVEETKKDDIVNSNTKILRGATLIHVTSQLSLSGHSNATHKQNRSQCINGIVDDSVDIQVDDMIEVDIEIGYVEGLYVECGKS